MKQVIGVSKDSVSGGVVTLYNDGTLALSIDKAYQKDGRKNLTVFQGQVGVKGFKVMLTVYGQAEAIKAVKDGTMSVEHENKAETVATGKTLVDL